MLGNGAACCSNSDFRLITSLSLWIIIHHQTNRFTFTYTSTYLLVLLYNSNSSLALTLLPHNLPPQAEKILLEALRKDGKPLPLPTTFKHLKMTANPYRYLPNPRSADHLTLKLKAAALPPTISIRLHIRVLLTQTQTHKPRAPRSSP